MKRAIAVALLAIAACTFVYIGACVAIVNRTPNVECRASLRGVVCADETGAFCDTDMDCAAKFGTVSR